MLVKLKNGSEELEALVAITHAALRSLFADKPLVAYELVMLCRDTTHEMFGDSAIQLQRLSLVTTSTAGVHVHDSIRNIVLSVVTGKGLDISLGDPKA